jgi:hypothetical protein
MSRMGSARAIAIARFVMSSEVETSLTLSDPRELTMVFGHPIEHVILVVEIENEMIAIR